MKKKKKRRQEIKKISVLDFLVPFSFFSPVSLLEVHI